MSMASARVLPPSLRALSNRLRGVCWGLLLAPSLSTVAYAQATPVPATSYWGIRQWGQTYFDTDSRLLPVVDIAANGQHSAVLRVDGRLFVQGQDYAGLCRAPAEPFVAMVLADRDTFAIRPDGTVAQWGEGSGMGPFAIPSLPPGISYTEIAVGFLHRILLRSDGVTLALGDNFYGQLNVPALPMGVVPVRLAANTDHSAMLTNVGSVLAWGDNAEGQCNVPTLPAGVVYTDVCCGFAHMLALRSDGNLAAWGSNFAGETSVPALPTGCVYLKCAAGNGWSVAWRSDGQLIAFGANGVEGNLDVPSPPTGSTLVKLAVGDWHGLALWSDGTVTGWGQTSYFPYQQPHPRRANASPSEGDRFAGVSPGFAHTLVLRADGTAEGYGNNAGFVCDVPQLPNGVVYTKVRAGNFVSGALRSDGQLIVWGLGPMVGAVPPLPAGRTYVDFDMAGAHAVALRSDGVAVAFGSNTSGQCNLPILPVGITYTQVDASGLMSGLLRSDGNVAFCGALGSGVRAPGVVGRVYVEVLARLGRRDDGVVEGPGLTVPVLPWGVYFVQMGNFTGQLLLRRSDGRIDRVGNNVSDAVVPSLEPGSSYLEIGSGADDTVAARVGSTCVYVGIVPGCAGSRPATRLVPYDTPRIGRPLKVTLFDLPNDIAVLGMSFQRLPTPVDLGFLGMPGCSLAISPDAVLGIVGQGGKAKWQLPIPDQPSLVGVRFYNQAIVLDVGAGNPFGAVMSDAMEGVVGYP
jgi:alpha-tubulin suppressor-like RCC1 family protein